MLGQIGLLQVDEGYTYKDFLILFADVSMEVVELVEGDVAVATVRHQPLCLQLRDPGTHHFTVRRVRRLPICNRQPSAHAQGPWAADVRGVAAHEAS